VIDYCDGDTLSLARLLPVMLPRIDLPHALFRGRYMAAVSAIEFVGTPIDVEMLELLRRHWVDIKDLLIADMDKDYDVIDGRSGSFATEYPGRCWPAESWI
jgi:DNA polymerase I